MAQLIDKDALVVEIRKLKESHDNWSYMGKCFHREYENLLSFIDTLEVKEVDLENTKSVFEGQYLIKDKVVTTIERLQDECEERGDNNGVELLEKLFNKLDTLEVKEVDLEDSIKESLAQKYIDYTFKRYNIDPDSKEGQLIYYAYMHGMNQCLNQLKAQKGE